MLQNRPAQIELRPALDHDFEYCRRLYFEEMSWIIEELHLDRTAQKTNLRQQWNSTQVRIIVLDGTDVGWVQTIREEDGLFLGQLFVDNKKHVEATPGSTVDIGVRITPGVAGPVTVDVERFDPLSGWQFYTRFRRTASGGRASIPFTPPTVGRWRVRATYDGTRLSAPSGPGRASFTVAEPLQE